jgi:hypothetical protein
MRSRILLSLLVVVAACERAERPVAPAPGDPPVTPGAGPNEPAGFRTLSDQSWSCPSPFADTIVCNGWGYARRSSTKPDDVIADVTAPFSSAEVLRIVFTPDMDGNMEPSVHWLGLPSVKSLYKAWWFRLSPNWDHSPWAAGAMTALFADGPDQIYTALFHPCASPDVCGPESYGPPYKIGASTEWAFEEQQIRYPNATTTWINPGEWHRVEFYYQWSTTAIANDGIIRWWVDGTLNGGYSDVHYPAGSFVELQFAPTLQQAPPAEQYMYIDHTRVSVP